MKKWTLKCTNEDINSIKGKSFIDRLLFIRGIYEKEDAGKFLNPDIADMADPYMMKDMDRAVDRIDLAIQRREKIIVYGDYDVDGITSTSLLLCALKKLGVRSTYYIPDRVNEGYGINKRAVDYIKSLGINLVISVDCGITSIEEVDYAKSKGLDIIITDHHECMDVIPDTIVVNPKRSDCNYPFKELAGCGVVLKLIQAIWMKYDLLGFEDFFDLAAIGTVADIVELKGENRIIVKCGINKIKNSEKCGIRAIKSVSGIKDDITSGNIAFQIAPRINAAGRLSDAKIAVELFTTCDFDKAMQIAKYLDLQNKKRQEIEYTIFNEALAMIQNEVDLKNERVIILSSRGWHAGVIGIVASKLVEKFMRPVILISIEDEVGRGSGRSVEGFNLFENLSKCSRVLLKYGGHALAAGITIDKDKIDEFKDMMNKTAENLDSAIFFKRIYIDMEINEDDLNIGNARDLKKLEPFGCGNSTPVFCMNDVNLIDKQVIGKDKKHLRFYLKKGSNKFDTVFFNGAELFKDKNWNMVDIAFTVDVNIWNNKEYLKVYIKDIKPSVSWVNSYARNIYYKHMKKMFSTENCDFDYSKIKFINKDYSFLDEFVSLNKGYILASSINSIEEISYLTDTINMEYNKPDDEKCRIILCPDIKSFKKCNRDMLIYDFLPGNSEYNSLCSKTTGDIYNFKGPGIAERLDKFIDDISLNEKNLLKFYDYIMYNEFIGTINEFSLKHVINPYMVYRMIVFLRRIKAINIMTKGEIIKITTVPDFDVTKLSAVNCNELNNKLTIFKLNIKPFLGEE